MTSFYGFDMLTSLIKSILFIYFYYNRRKNYSIILFIIRTKYIYIIFENHTFNKEKSNLIKNLINYK